MIAGRKQIHVHGAALALGPGARRSKQIDERREIGPLSAHPSAWVLTVPWEKCSRIDAALQLGTDKHTAGVRDLSLRNTATGSAA